MTCVMSLSGRVHQSCCQVLWCTLDQLNWTCSKRTCIFWFLLNLSPVSNLYRRNRAPIFSSRVRMNASLTVTHWTWFYQLKTSPFSGHVDLSFSLLLISATTLESGFPGVGEGLQPYQTVNVWIQLFRYAYHANRFTFDWVNMWSEKAKTNKWGDEYRIESNREWTHPRHNEPTALCSTVNRRSWKSQKSTIYWPG